ncbi:hypothetical protein [Escherichia coli]|uniref:hypothetical protein n=1 Tax=Escherichia coli TaxID=562 RepID=UPI00202ABDFE|nr:hypothetical protein [Escherichia coli]
MLGLIVNRTRANKNHKSSFYYTMTGHFQRGADVIRANWKPGEFAPLTDRKLLDKPGRMEQQHHLQENQPQLKRQQQMIKKRLHRCPLTWYDFSST